jgi:OOP family OmpA-OmpF porin
VRSDALTVESHKHSPEKWVDAEKKFREAAIKLEEGNVKDAQKKADESIPIYREAELDAIKDAYLSDALALIKRAKEMDVSDEAPRTLQNAEDLVKQAEQELSQNRYDTDRPRSLAQQAKYQAGHSIYLAGKIREMKDNDKKYEDLFLMAEEPLRSIAANFDIAAHFDEGLDKVGNQIDSSVTSLQDSLATMTRVLSDKEQEINNLNARVTELEGQLGDIAMEKTALTEKMEAQAKIRQNFNSVDKLFSEYEGRVLRQGDDIIIRLTGLSFDVGKAVIKPENFGLLTKVREAINIFPDARIVIQGHTDSYGSDDANFSLSQERADAVMAYLLANMNLEKSKIMAEGYGETVPIATNETPEGRAKNRRIDVVIKPVL